MTGAIRWDVDRPELTWTINTMHNPKALPPIMHDFRVCVAEGTNRAHRRFGRPNQVVYQLVNGYAYGAAIPAEPQVAARTDVDAAPTLERDWQDSYLPEILDIYAQWDRARARPAGDTAAQAHLEAVVERSARIWDIHFSVTLVAYVAIEAAMDAYRALVPDATDLDAAEIIQGYGNVTVAADVALWDAAQLARGPAAGRLVHAASPQDLRPTDPALADSLDRLLALYGVLGADQGDFFSTAWADEPAKLLREVATRIDRPDPRGRLREQTRARDLKLSALRASVAPEAWTRFAAGQDVARAGAILTEDHHFFIDRSWIWQIRQVCRVYGRWLADRGRLDDPDDVPFLRLDELRALLSGPLDTRADIRARRAAFADQQKLTPPTTLGVPGSAGRPGAASSRFWGGAVPEAAPGSVRGFGASPGIVRGRAVVLTSLDQTARLRPGDVLVCATTNASWVPLFDTAAAIVTDTGGVLSHAAVVAREFGVPAVVGTQTGTQRIRDGQLVEVDGTTGEVRLL